MKDLLRRELSSAEGAIFHVTDISPVHQDLLIEHGCEIPSRVSRFAEKRKLEFFSGRWCASECLFQLSQSYVCPGINEDRSPIWPDGFVGSISHSERYAMALVVRADKYKTCGIDFQEKVDQKTKSSLLETVLSADELARFGGQEALECFELFFSAKETLFKALYPVTKCFFEFMDAEVTRIDLDARVIELSLLKDLSAVIRAGSRHPIRFIKLNNETGSFTWYLPESL